MDNIRFSLIKLQRGCLVSMVPFRCHKQENSAAEEKGGLRTLTCLSPVSLYHLTGKGGGGRVSRV